MSKIHPTAIVSKKATIGDNITIAPYALIKDDVEIGNNCEIGPHAVIYNGARIGNNVKIFQSASVANEPQDLKYANEKTFFYIGDNCVIREFVTLHRGTKETGNSKIGNNCLIMAYAHIAHDCIVGNNVILSNSVQVGGHVHIEDFVIVGGGSVIHQFSLVGQHSMTGGGCRIVVDVPPYVLAGGDPLKFAGLNFIGLKRRGFSSEDLETLKKTYRIIYNSGLNFTQAKIKLNEEFANNSLVNNILNFYANSKRPKLSR